MRIKQLESSSPETSISIQMNNQFFVINSQRYIILMRSGL